MDKKLKAIRKRLYEDFPFYAKSALKIRTKEGEIAPLVLNPAQKVLQEAVDKQMASEGKIRIIILKARQQGLSTYVGGYLYFSVSQNKARKAMVISHTADSTRSLFDLGSVTMTMPPKYLGRTPNIHRDASCLSMFLTRLTSLRRRVAKVWEGARRSHTSMRQN